MSATLQRTADRTFANRLAGWCKLVVKLAFLASLILTVLSLALELGVKQKEYVFRGPFWAVGNPPGQALYVNFPNEGQLPWWRQPVLGDVPAKPSRSPLRVSVNDREIGPPHSRHADIQDGTTKGFSHWDTIVMFRLPAGTANGPETTVRLYYSVQPRPWVTLALAAVTALLCIVGYGHLLKLLARTLRIGLSPAIARLQRLAGLLLTLNYFVLLGLACVGLAGSAAFAGFSLYALGAGWALPTTAPLRWFSIADWAARNEPYLGYLLLSIAGLGGLLTWLSASNSASRYEQTSQRLFYWLGFPIMTCAFVLGVSAMWAGMLRLGDPQFGSIGGLVPFSDALGHYVSSYDQAKTGTWIAFGQRRPIATAFRTVLLFFSGYYLPIMLIVQASMVAAATCFATHAIAKWRGIWAGLAFLGLTYIYARIFVPTTLTEPLGLLWGLLSIPFFIDSLRRNSLQSAYLALAFTTVAMMTRMGSMFTIPAVLLWMVWQFGTGTVAKLRIGAAAICIVLGVLGTNWLLQKAYGTGPGSTTGNFAYQLCGLTLGTQWDGCLKKLTAEGRGGELATEETLVPILYAMAAENFKAQPIVFFQRLVDGAKLFVTEFPETMWRGYLKRVELPSWLFRGSLTALSLFGLIRILSRQADTRERSFWALVWASLLLSAAVVFYDDGARVLAGSYPLIALFFAIGIGSPARPSPATSGAAMSRGAILGLVITTLLLFVVPWTAHRHSAARALVGDNFLARPDEAFTLGGKGILGFMIIPDDVPLPTNVPALHFRDFKAIIRESGVESYQGLLNPTPPPLPFGFVFMPRLEKEFVSYYQYIVPPEVMQSPQVAAWHFKLSSWGHRTGPGRYWFNVTSAEPLK